jgi:hypothetical protein
MKTFIRRWLPYLWIVIFFTTLSSSYAHLIALSFGELARESKYIFVGEVLRAKRRWDGSMLSSIKVERVIKGAPPKNVNVLYGQAYNVAQEDLTQLKVGCSYIFYITDYEKKLYLLGVTGKDYYLISNNKVLCGDDKISVDACIERIKKQTYSK